MTKQELFEQMVTLFEDFKAEHSKTTKASQARARKLIGELKKLASPYRAASVSEAKGE